MFQKGSPIFQKLVNKLNDLRPRQLIMLAIAAAVLMFMTIYTGMSLLTKQEIVVQPQEQAPPPPAVEKTAVVVAKVNIPPRTRIQEEERARAGMELHDEPGVRVRQGRGQGDRVPRVEHPQQDHRGDGDFRKA